MREPATGQGSRIFLMCPQLDKTNATEFSVYAVSHNLTPFFFVGLLIKTAH